MKHFPKIGIRPVIDGRRNGVRESLEAQTMNMAQEAARLISQNLRHANGQAIECVVADTTIGGVAEAALCSEKFARENIQISLTVTPCWCYGTETYDDDPLRIKAVWGFNGTERPGAVYLAAVLAAHNQKGLPAFGIYGKDVQDANDTSIPADVREKILLFAKSAIAVATMRGKSYLSIGSVSMGIGGSIVNDSFFQHYLGMRNEYVDMSELIRRLNLGIYDKKEYEKALAWTTEHCNEGIDYNASDIQFSQEEKDSQWETVVKMTLIIRDLMKGNPKLADIGFAEESAGHNAIASGFQGQRQWTDFMPNGDFAEAILNSSFDWNGIREPIIVATENDSLNGATMLLSHLLTDTAQIFADVRTYWSADAVARVTGHVLTGKASQGMIHLINSGAAALDGTGRQQQNGTPVLKPFWEISNDEVNACLENVKWEPANRGYFRGGGFSSCFSTYGEMPVTMSRINMIAGLGPVLQIAEGYTVNLPADVEKTLWDRTDPAWPSTWFAPVLTGEGAFRDVYSVMNNWGANHGSFCYGHVGDRLITLAAMLRIPVNMHNVERDRIFRPSAWAAFGTEHLESADYRACVAYGPLYK